MPLYKEGVRQRAGASYRSLKEIFSRTRYEFEDGPELPAPVKAHTIRHSFVALGLSVDLNKAAVTVD